MTHDEMIAVIKAHKEGKQIQFREIIGDMVEWLDVGNFITFNFGHYEYRIKPEPHCRPFKNAEEVMEAIKEHGCWIKPKDGNSFIAITEIIPPTYSSLNVQCKYSDRIIDDVAKIAAYYTFADGTPFGIKEE